MPGPDRTGPKRVPRALDLAAPQINCFLIGMKKCCVYLAGTRFCAMQSEESIANTLHRALFKMQYE